MRKIDAYTKNKWQSLLFCIGNLENHYLNLEQKIQKWYTGHILNNPLKISLRYRQESFCANYCFPEVSFAPFFSSSSVSIAPIFGTHLRQFTCTHISHIYSYFWLIKYHSWNNCYCWWWNVSINQIYIPQKSVVT